MGKVVLGAVLSVLIFSSNLIADQGCQVAAKLGISVGDLSKSQCSKYTEEGKKGLNSVSEAEKNAFKAYCIKACGDGSSPQVPGAVAKCN